MGYFTGKECATCSQSVYTALLYWYPVSPPDIFIIKRSSGGCIPAITGIAKRACNDGTCQVATESSLKLYARSCWSAASVFSAFTRREVNGIKGARHSVQPRGVFLNELLKGAVVMTAANQTRQSLYAIIAIPVRLFCAMQINDIGPNPHLFEFEAGSRGNFARLSVPGKRKVVFSRVTPLLRQKVGVKSTSKSEYFRRPNSMLAVVSISQPDSYWRSYQQPQPVPRVIKRSHCRGSREISTPVAIIYTDDKYQRVGGKESPDGFPEYVLAARVAT